MDRLNVVVAVLGPVAIASGMYSMSDEFAPGKSRFWAFWVTWIPISLLLVSVLWYQYWLPMLIDQFKQIQHKLKRLGEEESRNPTLD